MSAQFALEIFLSWKEYSMPIIKLKKYHEKTDYNISMIFHNE